MQPRERVLRSKPRPPDVCERHDVDPPVHRHGRGSPRATRPRGLGEVAGRALGVCILCCACSGSLACHGRRLPEVSVVYRHDRDSRRHDHRVEVFLSRSPAPRLGSAPLAMEPFFAALDPCPHAPGCEARALSIEESERQHLWGDPIIDDLALEPRLDDVMLTPNLEVAR